jgi:hypothetical protein
VSFKLLPYLGADARDWHIKGVHGLDFGSLGSNRQLGTCSAALRVDGRNLQIVAIDGKIE